MARAAAAAAPPATTTPATQASSPGWSRRIASSVATPAAIASGPAIRAVAPASEQLADARRRPARR